DRVRFEDAGIDDVQHLRGLERAEPREPVLDPADRVRRRVEDWVALDAERIELVVRTSLVQGIAHTPTLALIDRATRMDRVDEQMAEPVMRLLPRFYSALSWDPRGFSWYEGLDAGHWALARQATESARRVVAALACAGVRIHAGTDVGNPFLVPVTGSWRRTSRGPRSPPPARRWSTTGAPAGAASAASSRSGSALQLSGSA
ncbi:MAG TPA: hypothetical protein VJM14_08165, partial [Burkholderiales bacterium]|nr:hypothetical protein [Burkholderiales bacterium]